MTAHGEAVNSIVRTQNAKAMRFRSETIHRATVAGRAHVRTLFLSLFSRGFESNMLNRGEEKDELLQGDKSASTISQMQCHYM